MVSQNASPLPPPVPRAPQTVCVLISFFSFILRAPNFMKKIQHIVDITVHTKNGADCTPNSYLKRLIFFFFFQRVVDDLRVPNFFRKRASKKTNLTILGLVRHS